MLKNNLNMDINICKELDLVGSYKSFLKVWGFPIVLIAIGIAGLNLLWWPPIVSGLLWSFGTLWVGAGCYVNGKRCGRVHCRILGILFPILGIAGIFIAFGAIPINWNYYWLIFIILLFLASLPEIFWRKYI